MSRPHIAESRSAHSGSHKSWRMLDCFRRFSNEDRVTQGNAPLVNSTGCLVPRKLTFPRGKKAYGSIFAKAPSTEIRSMHLAITPP
jgi:hypothetical protein